MNSVRSCLVTKGRTQEGRLRSKRMNGRRWLIAAVSGDRPLKRNKVEVEILIGSSIYE